VTHSQLTKPVLPPALPRRWHRARPACRCGHADRAFRRQPDARGHLDARGGFTPRVEPSGSWLRRKPGAAAPNHDPRSGKYQAGQSDYLQRRSPRGQCSSQSVIWSGYGVEPNADYECLSIR